MLQGQQECCAKLNKKVADIGCGSIFWVPETNTNQVQQLGKDLSP